MVGLAVRTLAVLPPLLLFLGGVASAFSAPALGALCYEIAPEGGESTLLGFFAAIAAAGVGLRPTTVLVGLLCLCDAVVLRVGVPEPDR